MSLRQKYTWNDFLTGHPELKEKGVKRTSNEGQKAFNAAFKIKVKEYLTERTKRVEVLKKRAIEKHTKLTETIKTLQKAKKYSDAKIYQKKVGKQDSWMSNLDKQTDRIKILQKGL